MATRIAWLLNFDADIELSDPSAYVARPMAAERIAQLRERVVDLIDPEDVVLESSEVKGDCVARAFCPTPSALARIAKLGVEPPEAPPLAVLRAVNDRAFCASLGHGLPASCFARNTSELMAQVRQPSPTGRYVIKRAFSFAGREQQRIEALDDNARGFCRRSFDRGEGVQIEPWVERLADFSRHGYLTQNGALHVGATREQRCDPMGRFLGMAREAAIEPAEDAQLLATLTTTGEALRRAGYFGPFGIDAFRYRWERDVRFNARCEINARFTMGYPRELLERALRGHVPIP